MVGFAHVVLHVSLCSAIARVAPQTQIAMRVKLTDHTGRQRLEQSFTVERGDGTPRMLAFDAPRGIFRLQIVAPQYECSAIDYLALLSEHDRNIAETLDQGIAPAPEPMLLEGTAPQSFLYAAPTFVMVDKNTPCKGPIDDTIPGNVVVENDQDAFYVWMYSDKALQARGGVQLALRLSMPSGEYHYVKIKVPFPIPWTGWPQSIQFNVEEQDIDSLAGEPVDVLLCPKLFRTSSG